MQLLDRPLRDAEFVVLDTETNGCGGEDCELTELGAVLVGGGELHDELSALVRVRAPLSRRIQRFTGITQQMVDAARPPGEALRELVTWLDGRVLVAHSASFDTRVLRQAFDRAGLRWPAPPVICTVALARRLAPVHRRRALRQLADALGIDVRDSHRALPDARTCARVFCALFPRLCAHAATIGDALELLGPRRPPRPRRATAAPPPPPSLDLRALPDAPGVYIFRDAAGAALYVGKSVALRSRARAHFAPSAPFAEWTAQAALVDHRETNSELGALVLESRLVKRLRPPGNVRLRRDDRLAYLRCRLDIPFPVLEAAHVPAPGLAINVGPLRSRHAAAELAEQLASLFGLRHCGRRLARREHPSAYGQMGRCLSPCLGDLDPNLYRRRLEEALALFSGPDDGGELLLAHLDEQMHAASVEQRYERAAWLRRRRRRLVQLLGRLGGVLRATHAQPRLVVAGDRRAPHRDAFWIVGGRIADWGPLPGDDPEIARRTAAALAGRPRGGLGCHVAPEEVDELRIVDAWLASHPETAVMELDDDVPEGELVAFARG